MQELRFYLDSHGKPNFAIYNSPTSRNFYCYTLTDPDLFRINENTKYFPPNTTILLSAEKITMELLKECLPEYFI